MYLNKVLTSWLLSLDATNKLELKSLHLSNLFSLHQVKTTWEFLRPTAIFYDPEFHFFRFERNQLWITKEFNAIIGFPVYCPPVLSYIPSDLPPNVGVSHI